MNSSFQSMRVAAGVVIAAIFLAAPSAAQQTVTLNPTRDNTVFEHPWPQGGETSNALGPGLYAGMSFLAMPERIRRALLHFDVAGALPAGATVVGAKLELTVTQARDVSMRDFFVHRVTTAWGNGTSVPPAGPGGGGRGGSATANDPTWTQASTPNTPWEMPGGDFETVASAQATVTNTVGQLATFSSTGMIADVQSWLDAPMSNDGWLIKGDEITEVAFKARRFASVDHPDSNLRPRLVIDYVTAPEVACRLSRVNTGASPVPTDVLRLNGSVGDGMRVVPVAIGEAISVDMEASPSGPSPGPFVLYLWLAQPSAGTVTPLPLNLGNICFPFALTGGMPQPFKIWNNVGSFPQLGSPSFPSTPAPSNVLNAPQGSGRAATATLQGILFDDGSSADRPASVTNAIVLQIG